MNKENEINMIKRRIENILSEIWVLVPFIVPMWTFFSSNRYILILNISLPLIGVVSYIKNRNEVEENESEEKGSKKFIAGIFIILPTFILFGQTKLSFNIIYTNLIWIYVVSLASVMLLVVLIFTEVYKNKALFFGMIVVFALYAYGAIGMVNGLYEHSRVERYVTTVVDKNLAIKRRGNVHWLVIAPWGELREKNKLVVTKKKYEKIKIGGELEMYVYQGILGIKWYKPEKSDNLTRHGGWEGLKMSTIE